MPASTSSVRVVLAQPRAWVAGALMATTTLLMSCAPLPAAPSASSMAQVDGATQEQLAAAQRALDTQDYGTAFRIYRPLAERGVPAAQGGMSRFYFNGWSVERNDTEALRWAHEGAKQNDPASSNILGNMFQHGRGVARNDNEAFRWYRLAADQGLARAQNNLGLMYETGRGVARDEVEAVRWYRRAADQGDATAQSNLGNMFAAGRGVTRNDTEAVRWYRLAADQGDARAQNILGLMYASRPRSQQNRQAAETQRIYNERFQQTLENRTSEELARGYFPITIQEFILDGRQLVSRGSKVSIVGFYLSIGHLDYLFQSLADASMNQTRSAVHLLTENASREFRSQLLTWRSNPGSAYVGRPIHVLGKATICVLTGPLGDRHNLPCIAIDDGSLE